MALMQLIRDRKTQVSVEYQQTCHNQHQQQVHMADHNKRLSEHSVEDNNNNKINLEVDLVVDSNNSLEEEWQPWVEQALPT